MTVRGYVDFLDALKVDGWAFDPDFPDDRLLVEAWSDGALVASGRADRRRPDLAANGAGAGDSAFLLRLAAPLDEAAQARLIVRARRGKGVAVELPRWTPTPNDLPQPIVLRGLGAPTDSEQRPLFILGASRSGTSAVAQGLMRATSICGNQEGRILELIGHLDPVVDWYFKTYEADVVDPRRDTMIKLVPKQFIKDAIAATFVAAIRQLFPGGVWLDKTPGPRMLMLAPRLPEIWPQARFLFMRRRPLENMASRLRKYPEYTFRQSCTQWNTCMQAWSEARIALRGRALELDQLCLARKPELAASEIGALLDLTPAEVAKLSRVFCDHMPEQTSEDFRASIDGADLGWCAEQWRDFDELCGPWMETYNYSRDRNYFASERDDNWFVRT